MNKSLTVLIIELDAGLAELEREILLDEGYHAIATLCGPSSLETVRKTNPDVIVLDLGYHNMHCGWDLLAALRSTTDTQGIPLLVVSDTENQLERAKQSFNVRQELIKPYEISALIEGVQAAVAGIPLLPHPAPPPSTGRVPVEASQVISRQAGTIMAEWLKRAQQEEILGTLKHIPMRLLMNDISVWLIGLVSALRYGPHYLGTAEIRAKLAEHIHEAQDHGLTIAQVIKQFEILRDVVWETLKQSLVATLTPQDVFSLAQTVNRALDEVLAQGAQEYAP